MRGLLLLLGLVAWAGPLRAQTAAPLDSLRALFPFLKVERNAIVNGEAGLRRFYRRLRQLPTDGGQVSVVHIGDSHIQADMFSGRLRRDLQRQFGNAGRGLIFPYTVAHTNEATGYRTATTTRWQARRVISSADSSLPIGVSGLVLATSDSGSSFSLQMSASRTPDYRFRRLTLLHRKGPTAFDWRLTDARGESLGTLPGRLSRRPDDFTSTLAVDSLLDFVRLTAVRSQPWQTGAQLYGLVLDNGQPGILYHAIGVNGAAVRHYNRAPLFFEQLTCLAPDLFIVSLGTNDAYDAGFDVEAFRLELAAFMQELHARYPRAEVLVTSPPDSYRARRYRNPDLPVLRDILQSYCQEHGLAYWDFYAVMGGFGSMQAWQTAGLAQPDRVHLTLRGYQLQAQLLYLALQDGFSRAARP